LYVQGSTILNEQLDVTGKIISKSDISANSNLYVQNDTSLNGQLYIEGKLKTETWKDKEGIEKSRLKVRVQNFTLLGGTKNNNEGGAIMTSTPPINVNTNTDTVTPTQNDSLSDDLPF
jgi:hypothetical protein